MLHCSMICLWKGRIVSSQNDLSLERKIVSLQYDLFLERKKFFVVAVVTRPLPRDGAWRNTMDPQTPGNSSRPGPEIVKRRRVAKERAAQRVR